MRAHSLIALSVVFGLACPAAVAAQTAKGDLSGEVSVSKVLAPATAVDESDDTGGGSSTVVRGSLDYDLDFGATDVSVSYDSAARFYDDNSRADRWSNRWTAGVGSVVSDTVELFGQVAYASNIGTVEASSTDQIESLARLQFSPNRANRLRVFGGYRWRDYDADDSDGAGPFYGAEYRYRPKAGHYLTADLRREEIDSDAPRRGYDRTIASLFYQAPLGESLRLSGGVTARWWDFAARLTPNGERLTRRTYTPELELQYATRPGLLLRGQLQYSLRNSNDPAFSEDIGRATLTAGYRF